MFWSTGRACLRRFFVYIIGINSACVIYFSALSVCDKNHSTNNSFELEKGQIHSGITLTVFAMSESPKFHHTTKKYKSRIEKRIDRLASRSIAYFFRDTETRYPCVTTAAAQQRLSSSTAPPPAAAAAQQKQRRRWRRRRRRQRQHGKPCLLYTSPSPRD